MYTLIYLSLHESYTSIASLGNAYSLNIYTSISTHICILWITLVKVTIPSNYMTLCLESVKEYLQICYMVNVMAVNQWQYFDWRSVYICSPASKGPPMLPASWWVDRASSGMCKIFDSGSSSSNMSTLKCVLCWGSGSLRWYNHIWVWLSLPNWGYIILRFVYNVLTSILSWYHRWSWGSLGVEEDDTLCPTYIEPVEGEGYDCG